MSQPSPEPETTVTISSDDPLGVEKSTVNWLPASSILADLRPGDRVTLMLSPADEHQAAVFCQSPERDRDSVEYLLNTMQHEFHAHLREAVGGGGDALAVGDAVVALSDMDDVCYRGVILALPDNGRLRIPVLQIDFGNVIKVNRYRTTVYSTYGTVRYLTS